MLALTSWRTSVCVVLGVLGVLIPAFSQGASDTQQEYETVLHAKPDVAHGEVLFATCAACHGRYGAGDSNVPLIAGQHFRILVRELVDYRHNKRWDPRMESLAKGHQLSNTQDLADVATYISGLAPQQSADVGDGALVEHGSGVYARLCVSCHGPLAQGSDRGQIPKLAGQRYGYLLRQMHDAVESRRPNFSPEHIRLLQRFDRDDFVGVSDYLSRLSP
ncbi:MAG: c-type cytochrome [Steroidobacteraceae bacterium]|jgi:cytochrome c553